MVASPFTLIEKNEILDRAHDGYRSFEKAKKQKNLTAVWDGFTTYKELARQILERTGYKSIFQLSQDEIHDYGIDGLPQQIYLGLTIGDKLESEILAHLGERSIPNPVGPKTRFETFQKTIDNNSSLDEVATIAHNLIVSNNGKGITLGLKGMRYIFSSYDQFNYQHQNIPKPLNSNI